MIEFIVKGGAFMYVIAGVSILAVAIMIERYVVLTFTYKVKEQFFEQLISSLVQRDLRGALSHCYRTTHPLARVVVEVLKKWKLPQEGVESAAAVSMQKIVPKIQRRTGYLNMLGNVATLIGLLGTIDGLVVSFTSLSAEAGADKAALLAKGISTAMNTTAFGLMVAIPCLIAYNILSNKENAILNKYEEVLSQVIHIVVHDWQRSEVSNDKRRAM